MLLFVVLLPDTRLATWYLVPPGTSYRRVCGTHTLPQRCHDLHVCVYTASTLPAECQSGPYASISTQYTVHMLSRLSNPPNRVSECLSAHTNTGTATSTREYLQYVDQYRHRRAGGSTVPVMVTGTWYLYEYRRTYKHTCYHRYLYQR